MSQRASNNGARGGESAQRMTKQRRQNTISEPAERQPANNPKNAPSGAAARRKASIAAIRATGAPKTITRVWMVLADRCAFAGDGWGEASYVGLLREAHASERSARYAAKYGAAIDLFEVDVRPTAGRGGWNLPNRYRFTLASYDPSAVESFKEWRARVGNIAYPDGGRQIAPGSVLTRPDRDEVPCASRTSLSGAEHPQAANAGKNGNGRSGCSAPDGPASVGTGSGRDCEQQARADLPRVRARERPRRRFGAEYDEGDLRRR